jgi:hypothetical protein
MSNISSLPNPQRPPTEQPFDWRKHLPVHPAAELFPLMSETDPAALKELAGDIKAHGHLLEAITLWRQNKNDDWQLLDGRNRLDAMALAGMLGVNVHGKLCHAGHEDKDWSIYTTYHTGGDPFALALSLNVHRRHLTNEDKDRLITELIKADPKKSNRQIAAQSKVASHPHVAKVRTKLEKAGDVETVSTSIDTKGRKQPAKRKSKAKKSNSTIASPVPIEAAINTAPEAKLAEGATLDSAIEREWLEAERAFEALSAHTVEQIAQVIPPEKIALVTEIAERFTAVVAKLADRSGDIAGTTVNGSDHAIPNNLGIPESLRRDATS